MARPPIAVAISFIDAINRHDLTDLGALMTEQHALVVFDEPPLEGRAANMDAWDGYLTSYPDYVIHPHAFGVDGARVATVGTTTGSHLGLSDEEEMRQTLVWVADISGDKVARWTLLADTPEQRHAFALPRAAQEPHRPH
jgi:hypothetical protein